MSNIRIITLSALLVAAGACKPQASNSSNFSSVSPATKKVLLSISCKKPGAEGSMVFFESQAGVSGVLTIGNDNGQMIGYSTHDFDMSVANVAYENDKGTLFWTDSVKSGVKCMTPEQADKDVACPIINSFKYSVPESDKQARGLSVNIVYSYKRNETTLTFDNCTDTGSKGSKVDGVMEVCTALKNKFGEKGCSFVD